MTDAEMLDLYARDRNRLIFAMACRTMSRLLHDGKLRLGPGVEMYRWTGRGDRVLGDLLDAAAFTEAEVRLGVDIYMAHIKSTVFGNGDGTFTVRSLSELAEAN